MPHPRGLLSCFQLYNCNSSVAARVEDPGGEVGPLILDVVSLGGFKLHSA